MTDKLLTLLQEFKYWRSSIPTGLLLSFVGLLAVLNCWPILSQPEKWVDRNFWPIFSAIGIPVWLLIGLAISALLGAWWCGLASGIALLSARGAVVLAPLHLSKENWCMVRRLWTALYLPEGTARRLRSEMLSVGDYLDLEEIDKPVAFRIFVQEAVGPYLSTSVDKSNGGELLKLWTDLRLSCGLLLPLTIAVYFIPSIVDPPLPGLDTWTTFGAIIVFLVLLVESIVRIRRVLELSILAHLDVASLERCARAANGVNYLRQDNA